MIRYAIIDTDLVIVDSKWDHLEGEALMGVLGASNVFSFKPPLLESALAHMIIECCFRGVDYWRLYQLYSYFSIPIATYMQILTDNGWIIEVLESGYRIYPKTDPSIAVINKHFLYAMYETLKAHFTTLKNGFEELF